MIKLNVSDNVVKLSLSPDDVGTETVSVDVIVEHLMEAGVSCGIQDDAISDVVHQVVELEVAVEDVVVARQIEPQDERPAAIIQVIEDGQVAAAGDTVAKLGEITAAVDGQTVLGETIEATSPAPITTLTAGANTEVVDEKILRASIYGTVTGSGADISVVPPVTVQDEGMSAAIDIYRQSSEKTPITADMVWDSLQAAGVIHGLENNKIETAIQEVQESDSPLLQQIVATGSTATASTDAHIEHFMETDQKIGEEREDGSMDYQQRSTIRNVESGIRICRLIPAVDGEPRTDVYGQTGAIEQGDDIDFEPGENVELRNDDFWSLIDGAVMIKNNIVSITDMFSHGSDIDLQSGNLQHDKGGVHIKGTVRSGFGIQAGSHIIVEDTVEDATLTCGGDIQIMGGVIHADDGRIDAAGTVTVKFAQNARITAGESIVINGPAMNCHLTAGHGITVSGNKARLVGGIARATDGCRFQQLGAENGAPTIVEIGVDKKLINALQLEIDELQEAIDAGQAKDTELKALSKRMDKLKDTSKETAIVEIEGTAYPGVTVRIFGVQYVFISERSKCRLRLDEERKIKLIQLA